MAKIEWNLPKKKKVKSDWSTSGLSRLMKNSHDSVTESLNRQFGVPVVNPKKKKKKRRANNNDIF